MILCKELTHYQKKGLGTTLLKFVINWAKKRNIKQISGFLTEEDLQNNPNLVRWYQQYNFRLEPPYKTDRSHIRHRILLDLLEND
ncbi:MAG: GNAT family N-acetyltransferase [Actinomycetota bacterium]